MITFKELEARAQLAFDECCNEEEKKESAINFYEIGFREAIQFVQEKFPDIKIIDLVEWTS